MATTPSSTAASSGGGRAASSSREGSAKATVADQISQAVLSTSNLLHLMQKSSPSQAHPFSISGGQPLRDATLYRQLGGSLAQLMKLPKNLLAKTSTIKNTEHMLGQMPLIISSLDAHMDNGLQSVPHLKTVIQLLSNIESCQLKSLSKALQSQETL